MPQSNEKFGVREFWNKARYFRMQGRWHLFEGGDNVDNRGLGEGEMYRNTRGAIFAQYILEFP